MALVRPAGMSDQAVEEWLRVAAQEVCHLPRDILSEGCARARRTCTHHAQIVPAIIKGTEEWLQDRRELVSMRYEKPIALPKQERWQPKPGELDEIKQMVADSLSAKNV